jgi:hypothetical protein
MLISFTLLTTSCRRSNSNIKDYLNTGTQIDTNSKNIMPTLGELPKYQNIEYKYTHKTILMFIFESESVALIVKYDDETYKSEKNKLAEKYVFLSQKVGEDIIPEYEFLLNGYTFKVVAGNEKNSTEFPKSFGLIGTSDEKKSISYLYFYDVDLDYIGERNEKSPMANFVNEYFDYDF